MSTFNPLIFSNVKITMSKNKIDDYFNIIILHINFVGEKSDLIDSE